LKRQSNRPQRRNYNYRRYEFPALQPAGIFLILWAMVKTARINVETKGNCAIVNITKQVSEAIGQSDITDGTVTLFNVGSTAGITTTEYEPGLVNYDIAAAFEKIAPQNGRYEHEETWHDDNGHSHVRAALLGPSLSVPVVDGQLSLGTWQQIILVDFDTRPRTRTIICQIIGE
jgi:secondary thiamine-phosphate synthase enzyme